MTKTQQISIEVPQRISRLMWIVVILAIMIQIACAQRELKEIVGTDEVSIKFAHVGKLGETKTYLTSFKQIPNVPAIPRGYRLLTDKSYFISSKTIELGDPIITFRIPAQTAEEFSKFRVMRLRTEVPLVEGYEWRDCTISTDNIWQSPRYDQEQNREHLPEFSQRTLKCHVKDGLRPDEYFVIVVQEQAPPNVAFTNLTFAVEGKPRRVEQTEGSYKIIIKNVGQKDVAELSIFSTANANMVSAKPDQGACQQSDRYDAGVTTCKLGRLPANGHVAVHFEMSRIPENPGSPRQNNFGWNIDVVIKEQSQDPVWPANVFSFEPLSDKYWKARKCCDIAD
jgi:hypothetical protein